MLISLDEEAILSQQLIKIIKSFSLSIAFFEWFCGKELVIKTIFEEIKGDIFERVGEYYISDLKIYSGGVLFFLDKVQQNLSQTLHREKHQYYTLLGELSKLKKEKISETLNDSKYTVISQLSYLFQHCGTCWEIYDMKNLVKVYKKRMNGP